MRENVPLFAILEESLTMILGNEFENIVFDRQHILSDEESDYVVGFAKPYAVAMLFKSLLQRLKAIHNDFTADLLKAYFEETARNVYWLFAKPDTDEQAAQLISIALGFLDFNLVFDINDSDLEPDDEPPITKFLDAVFPECRTDDPLQQRKMDVVVSFARLIEEKLDVMIDNIFAQAHVTL